MSLVNLNRKLARMDRGSSATLKRYKKTTWLKRILLVLVVLIVITILPARGIYQSAQALNSDIKLVNQGLKQNDLNLIKQGVKAAHAHSGDLNGSLNWLFWMRIIPLFGGYYTDSKHFALALNYELDAGSKLVDYLEPYKNEIGLNGQVVAGQDKVSQLAKILDKSVPNLEKIEPDLKKAREEVEKINTSKYPQNFGTRRVRPQVEAAKNFIIGADLAVTQGKTALLQAPSALGVGAPKTYLMLFQNDKELRATGGFLTAYAFLKLDQGHLSTTVSDDIYRLDERLLKVCLNKICPLSPPAPIVRYLPEANGKPRSAWSMRDSNLSPDLPTSMKTFEGMYQLLGEGLPFDGVITIDTQVVEELIAITGPIKVFDTTYSANTDPRCNCPNVIYELEHYAEIASKGEQDRKAILGALMQQLLATVLASGPEKLPDFVNTGVKLAGDKHIMFYMHNSQLQSGLKDLGWTGEIDKNFDGAYLHINDSNFAGGKSNLYVDEKVTYDLSVSGETLTTKLTIEYKNPQAFNTWLNGILRDYIRVYAPAGSKLISNKGSDDPVNSADDKDLNKTYFDGFVQVRPQNSRKLELEYTSPVTTKNGKLEVLIQKQPGAKDHHYVVKYKGSTKAEFDLTADHKFEINI